MLSNQTAVHQTEKWILYLLFPPTVSYRWGRASEGRIKTVAVENKRDKTKNKCFLKQLLFMHLTNPTEILPGQNTPSHKELLIQHREGEGEHN